MGSMNTFQNNIHRNKVNFKKFDNVEECEQKLLISSKENFNVIHINIRSLRKHWNTLQGYLVSILKYLDVLVLTEVNVKEDEITLYSLDNFDSYSRCRLNGNGGGILVFVRRVFVVERLFYELEECEHLCLKIQNVSCNFDYILSCIYRPPSRNLNVFIEQLNNFLNEDGVKKHNSIVLGDVNICTIVKSKHSFEYLNTLISKGFLNTISDYTREEIVNQELQRSCIDHINIKIKNHKNINSFVIKNKVADHYFVGCSIATTNNKQYFSKLKNNRYKKSVISTKKINEEIDKTNWASFLELNDPIELYHQIKRKFDEIYNVSKIEIVTNELDRLKPWINDKVKEKIKEKESLFNLWKSNKSNEEVKKAYHRCRNKLTSLVRKQYNKYYLKQFKENANNINKTWALTNEVMGKKKKLTPHEVLRKHFPHQSCDDSLCNIFNNNFVAQVDVIKQVNMGPKLTLGNNHYSHKENDRSIYWNHITMQSLEKAVGSINITSPGNDGIRLIDLKNNFKKLSHLLLHFMNLMFDSGIVPPELKISTVTPLHKKGRKDDINNYRPIGNVPALAKILEKIVNNKIHPFIESSNIIPHFQHGFRPGRSTGSLLDDFAGKINQGIDQRKYCVVAFIDLMKAFETLDHRILMSKLQNAGIRHKILRLIGNYLENRTQITKIGNFVSSKKPITYGLVQGSCLSPGFYNVYSMDIQYLNTKCSLFQFADDLAVVSIDGSINRAIQNLQEDIILIEKWFYNNEIFMNSSKTKIVLIKSPHKKINEDLVKIKCHSRICLVNGTYEGICPCLELEFSDEEKYVGLKIDSNFKFNNHIEFLASKLRVVSYKMNHIKHCVPQRVMWVIYKSLFESLLRYGLTCYGFASKTTLNQISAIQINIVKSVFKETSEYPSKILNIHDLHKFILILKYFFCPEYRQKEKTPYLMRNQGFKVTKVNSSYGKRTPSYFVPHALNSLESLGDNVLSINNYGVLKETLMKHIDVLSLDSPFPC